MRLRFIPLPVILALVAGQAVAGERSVTPFELLPPGDIVVPVTIDGQGPFRMLLDTGASRSAVTTAVARLLDSRVVGETTMVTPAGRERRPLVLLKRVTLGGSGSSSVVGMQLDDDDLNPTIDGLIGQDILAARVYTIDYTERAIVWHTGADTGLPGTRLDVDLDRGRMLVSLPQRVEGGTTSTAIGTVLRLIPDSGADRLVLFSHAELPHLVTVDVGLLKSAAGTRHGAAGARRWSRRGRDTASRSGRSAARAHRRRRAARRRPAATSPVRTRDHQRPGPLPRSREVTSATVGC